VGERLHVRSHQGHTYRSWLDTYADPVFAQSTRRAIDIVAGAAALADSATRAAMHDAFVASSRHELAFFAAER
jgi:thiaminase